MELRKYSVAHWFKLLLMTGRLESKVRKMKNITVNPSCGDGNEGRTEINAFGRKQN